MVRFTADVDSPPAKQPPNIKVEDTSDPTKPVKRRRWRPKFTTEEGKESFEIIPFPEMRRFKAEKIRSRHTASPISPSSGTKRKSITRCSIEMTLLLTIALALGYFVVKDMDFTSKCDTQLPEQLQKQLTQDLQARVFRQEIAIQNISLLLRAHKGLTTMSFVGGCGTGKSFTVKQMANHFSEHNSHAYNWADGRRGNLIHLAALQKLILDLPPCQPQLLIVDNLAWAQKPYVEDMSRWLNCNSRLGEKNLVIVYIFNLQRFGEEEQAEEEEEEKETGSVGELDKTNIVIFKSFQERDVLDYLQIQVEKDREIDEEHLKMIVENANVKQFGLKRLANKFQTIE